MSEESALAFIRRVEEEPTIQEKIKTKKGFEGLLEVAMDSGFYFTGPELQAAIKRHAESKERSPENVADDISSGLGGNLEGLSTATSDLCFFSLTS